MAPRSRAALSGRRKLESAPGTISGSPFCSGFCAFGYPLADPSRTSQTEPEFETSFWKDSSDPLANEPIQVVLHTENAKHSFANLGHLCPRPFSLIISPEERAIRKPDFGDRLQHQTDVVALPLSGSPGGQHVISGKCIVTDACEYPNL